MLDTIEARHGCNEADEKSTKYLDDVLDKIRQQYHKKLDDMEKNPPQFSGRCVVVFEFHEGRNKCLKYFLQKQGIKMQDTSYQSTFKGKTINASISEDPSDFLWKNQGWSPYKRGLRFLYLNIFTVIWMVGVIYVMSMCAWVTNFYRDDKGLLGFGLASPKKIANGIGAGGCNLLLLIVMPIISLLARLKTRSEMEMSTFIKCSCFQAIAVYVSTMLVFGAQHSPGGTFDWSSYGVK